MHHLYFLRHCKTVFNLEKIISGRTNSELCSEAEIKYVDLLKSTNKLVIMSSDLQRCQQTIELLRPFIKSEYEIRYFKLLQERDMGIFEGKSRLELTQKYPEFFVGDRFLYFKTPPEGESIQELQKRIIKFIQNEFSILYSNYDVLICAHNQVLKMLYCKILHIPVNENWSKLDFPEGGIRLIY